LLAPFVGHFPGLRSGRGRDQLRKGLQSTIVVLGEQLALLGSEIDWAVTSDIISEAAAPDIVSLEANFLKGLSHHRD
jgi:hypothetical protein